MTATSGWLDAGGVEVDVVGADGCGGACSESGDGGVDGVGEWSGVIGLGEVQVSSGLSGWGGESNSENIWLIWRFMSS